MRCCQRKASPGLCSLASNTASNLLDAAPVMPAAFPKSQWGFGAYQCRCRRHCISEGEERIKQSQGALQLVALIESPHVLQDGIRMLSSYIIVQQILAVTVGASHSHFVHCHETFGPSELKSVSLLLPWAARLCYLIKFLARALHLDMCW